MTPVIVKKKEGDVHRFEEPWSDRFEPAVLIHPEATRVSEDKSSAVEQYLALGGMLAFSRIFRKKEQMKLYPKQIFPAFGWYDLRGVEVNIDPYYRDAYLKVIDGSYPYDAAVDLYPSNEYHYFPYGGEMYEPPGSILDNPVERTVVTNDTSYIIQVFFDNIGAEGGHRVLAGQTISFPRRWYQYVAVYNEHDYVIGGEDLEHIYLSFFALQRPNHQFNEFLNEAIQFSGLEKDTTEP